MKYYIIAGEASGDLHGSNLIKAIFKKDAHASIRCWGGDLMEAAGGQLIKHYRDLAFMGFIEVVKNLPVILKNIKFCKSDIQKSNPDILILIDYPGFNLRIAEWAKLNGYKVIYYISPQVWAWKSNRVKKMKKYIDKMFVILPFEKQYFQHKWKWDVEYIGHPLIEAIQHFRKAYTQPILSFDKPVIALLPGSRKQEIKVKLPIMLEVCSRFPDYHFVIAKAPGIDEDFYDELICGHENISYVINQTYPLLQIATAALVTSGTATLETALFKVPQIVCYKGSKISYEIARRVIRIKYISLVNLIMDSPVIKELIQDDLTPDNIAKELYNILPGGTSRNQILQHYDELEAMLQIQSSPSDLLAQSIITN
jgi:lipid-A-disaccharide synthase